MNILILSVGTRNKIVQYFKKELSGKGKVIATDCSKFAPAIYEADEYFIVPRIDDKDYLPKVLDICKKQEIRGVLSLIDPELTLLAQNKQLFEDIGTKVIISDIKAIELAFDKMEMYRFCCANNINTAKSYDNLDDFYRDLENKKIDFPVFTKPITGSCGVDTNKINNKEELEFHFNSRKGMMIQEFMSGEDVAADVYIDLISKEVISIYTKKKILMRAGETLKAVSFKDYMLFDFIEDFVKKAGFLGIIDLDIFVMNGKYYLSEVNPRIGGVYPHAHEGGCNFVKMVINNLNGIPNKSSIGDYKEDMYMLKYWGLMVREIGE